MYLFHLLDFFIQQTWDVWNKSKAPVMTETYDYQESQEVREGVKKQFFHWNDRSSLFN